MSGKLNTLLLLGNVFYFRGGKLRAKENSKYLHGHHPSANDGTSIEGLHRSKRLFLHRKSDPMLPSVCQVNQTRASSKNASSSWKTNEINSKLDKKIEYEVQFSSHHTLLIRRLQSLIPSLNAKNIYITTGHVYLTPLLEIRLRVNQTNSTLASPRIPIDWYQRTKIPTTIHGSLIRNWSISVEWFGSSLSWISRGWTG